jgi:lactaldehyde dehydrogenase / glycolaldehyde dehydrogenase
MKAFDNFINGRFVRSHGEKRIDVINPATGSLICTVPDSTEQDVNDAIAAADEAQRSWGALPAAKRAGNLKALAAKIRQNVEPIARVITEEQGKTLGLARVEVEFTADYLDYMAEWGRRIEGEIIESDREKETIFLFRRPIGVIGGILPWNFPFFLIARKAGPALITGNSIVIKPSEETPHNALKFCDLLAEMDFPAYQRCAWPRPWHGACSCFFAKRRNDQLYRQREYRIGGDDCGGEEYYEGQS